MEAARRRCREVLGAGSRAARGRKRGRRAGAAAGGEERREEPALEPALELAAETLAAWENARTSAQREAEIGTIADALRARKQQENKVLLGLVAIGTPREGAALTLKDASTVACAEEDLAKLLVKDSDHEKAVAVVLAERARSTLSTCLRHDGLAVIVTSFTIHDLWQPKPETGLLSGPREAVSATSVMESSPTGYAWADYPLGSLSQTCLRHGVYLEIDDLFVLKPRAVTTEVQGSLPLLVRAVSPVIQANRSDQPYALVHVADPETRKDRFLVLRKGAQTLATVLRPGDTLDILGGMAGLPEERVHHIADGSRAKKYHTLTASTPIRIVPRIPDEAVWATAGTETGSSAVSQQSGRELSSECSYMGRISRRLGAFVLELDGITKVFFSHVPPSAGGRGLRVGAILRLDQVHRLYFHGVFAGFVMTMRSTVSILNFAPLPHDTTNDNDVSRLACVRMSPSQQSLLPSHLDALTSFWVLASLVQLSHHLTPRVLHAVSFFTKTRDFLASVATSQGRANAVRDIWDEFMLGNPLGMQGQARISNGRPSAAPVTLPLFVSVQKIKQGALTFLQRQGVRKLPSVKNGIKDMHKENHFVSLSAETAAQSMGQPVALVGCIETSEKTGQLIFRDRTEAIEIYLTQALEDYVHKMLSSKSSTNADMPLMLALTSCSISIEALHARSLRDIRLTRQPQSGVPILLWDDQYIEADPDREGVFRLYLEAAEFHQVNFDERPFRPRTLAPGPEMGYYLETVPSFAGLLVSRTLPCRRSREPRIAESILNFWSGRLQYVDVVCKSRQFPQYWNFLRVGQVYRIDGAKAARNTARGTRAAADTHVFEAVQSTRFFALDASIRRAQREAYWKKHPEPGFTLDKPQSISSVFERSPSSRTQWALEGIVSIISLREAREPETTPLQGRDVVFPSLLERCTAIFLELRDLHVPMVLGLYISDVSRIHLPPGALRIGSKVTVYNPDLTRSGQKVYCRLATNSCIRVESVMSPHESEIAAPQRLRELPVCNLADALLQGLSAPLKIAFVNVVTGISQLSFALAERCCRLCGWAMGGREKCPKGCIVPDAMDAFEVMTKVAAILDDGSGQGQLFVDGPMALRVLGMDSRQHALHLRDLTRDAVGGKVVFKSGNLPMYAQGLENVDVKELKNLPPPQRAQAEFERFVMARQLSTTEKLFIYAKCKHNLSQSDRTMFHREQAYFAPINVGKKDTVLTASLPKLVLIGLHVERVDDTAALARALLFP